MSSIYYGSRRPGISGHKLYWRATGTSTPQNVYQDADLTTPHANPTVCEADGYWPVIYLDPSLPDYRVIHTDGSNEDDDPTLEVEIEPTLDDVPSSNNQAQTYTVKGTRPRILLWQTDASTNAKKWYVEVNDETLVISEVNDAESSATVLFSLPRGRVVQTAPLTSSGATLDISSLKVGHVAYIFKTSATSRTSTTTPTADPVLQFTSAPAGTYHTEGMIIYDADASGDIVINWPRAAYSVAGSMVAIADDGISVTDSGTYPFAVVMSGDITGIPAGVDIAVTINGIESATAGQTLGPHWCQGTSNATATRVLAGSWLKVTRLT